MIRFCFVFLLHISICFAQNPLEKVKKDLTPFVQSNTYTSFEKALQNPDSVLVLDLGDQKLKTLSPDISKFKNLKTLILYGNELKTLPIEITVLKNLEYLDLYNNSIATLPAGFEQLQKLKSLDLGWNKFKTIPPVVFQLKNLTDLYLYANRIKTIEPQITNLKNLQSLRVGKGLKFFAGGNRITKLPENFGELSNLQELYLPDNPIRKLPKSFADLDRLRWLDLSHTRFLSIPKEIQLLDSLETLLLWDRGFDKENMKDTRSNLPNANIRLEKKYEGNFWGLMGGYQYGGTGFVELGVARAFKKDFFTMATGLSVELNQDISSGIKASVFVNSIISGGIHAIYYSQWGLGKNASLALRPELGFGVGVFSLTYGYNFIFNRSAELTNPNTHMVSLRFILPVFPYFNVFGK